MNGANNPQPASEPLSLEQLKLDGFRRIKTHSAVMLLPRVIMSGVLHRRMLAAEKRQADGHRHQMRLLGEDVGNQDPAGISLAGDTVNHIYQKASTIGPLLGGGTALAALLGVAAWMVSTWQAPGAAPAPTAPSVPPLTAAPPFVPNTPAAAPLQDWRLGIQVKAQP